MKNLTLRGHVIVFTEGEYSDYRLSGFIVAAEDIDIIALSKEFTSSRKDYNISDFPSWLISKGYGLPIAYREIHIGSYGELEINFPDK